MARRGDLARENVTKIIVDAFGDNFVTIQDKKIYVMGSDGGEMVQFAISLTMPKTPVEAGAAPSFTVSHDWSTPAPAAVASAAGGITAEDQKGIEDIIAHVMSQITQNSGTN